MSAASFPTLRYALLLSLTGLPLAGASGALAEDVAPSASSVEQSVTQGALRIVQKDGGIVECPLKHTDVQADIAGFVARVRVTQTFHNPTREKVEAVYVFPLPQEAAVDEMTMVVGERKIVGLIKRRAEARTIYEAALRGGQTAALLEQERPNIFTQSVGNIEPDQEVKIEIGYVDVLRYDMGTYEFHFPMVVGPRYIPGSPSGGAPATPANLQGKVSPPVADTDRVPDASRISPPVLKPGVRNGHDISLSVKLDAGVPIQNVRTTSHDAGIDRRGDRQATIMLSPADSIPNKDFVLRYLVVGDKPEMAVLGHTGNYSGDSKQLGNGYFLLMIQPKEDERLTKTPPREIVFLVDVSGSMSGEPTNKVIQAMQGMLKLCREKDTVQVITFASQAHKLFEKPVPVNDANIGKALNFTSGLKGAGGTEMLKGVQMAIDEPIDKERLRIVVMLTDGYIGNEAEIIEHVGKHCGDQIRFWCVGIGSSPNMFLVDGVARQGGGMGKNLNLPDDAQPLVQEIMTRIQRAQLAKLSIDWGDLKVSETYPAKLPELWAGRPVIVYGRYSGGTAKDGSFVSEITVKGNVEGEDVSWPLTVSLPQEQKGHDALAKVWARQKIEDLMHQTYYQGSPAVEEAVTAIALDYKLMSQYTSFVAVDSRTAVDESAVATPPRRMLVPVPLPAGTRWEGFFGPEGEAEELDVGFGLLRFNSADKKELASLKQSMVLGARPQIAMRLPLQQSAGKRFATPLSGPVAAGTLPAPNSPTGGASIGSSAGGAYGRGGVAAGRPVAQQGQRRPLAVDGRVDAFGRGRALGDLQRGTGRGLARDGLRSYFYKEAAADHPVADLNDFLAITDWEFSYAAAAISPQAAKLAEAAKAAIEAANSKENPVEDEELRRLLAKAALLDSAVANFGQSDGSIAAAAIPRLNDLHEDDVRTWSEKQPQLKAKLDLVIRDQSLEQALATVAKAANIEVRLLEGSAADAAALTQRFSESAAASPRISYLDLRHATAAQALNWILQPLRLSWRPEANRIVASSDRRRNESGWTYDVSAIALPLDNDLKKLGDDSKMQAEAQKAADEFIAALRNALKVDEVSLVWFAPGQLLLFGAPAMHAALAGHIASLEQGAARPAAGLATLSDTTRKRFAARKERMAKADAAARKLDAALAHDQFSWQLLAAAAGGKLDLEAVTELELAWRSPQTSELLAGESRSLVLRSLWTICEAARVLPAENELSALAATAREKSAAAVASALIDAGTNKGSQSVLASAIYAALANSADRAYAAKLLTLLAASETDEATKNVRLLGRVLLGEITNVDRQALSELIAAGVGGADPVALIAFACRKAGDATWARFRAQSRELLGEQPLPGEVVILINRLPGLRLEVNR
jgi:Ca-activated chloride channel family protein